MSDHLICQSLNIQTTSACTLKCKNCGLSYPKYHMVVDADKTIAALETVFKIFDYMPECRIAGAEAFLYPDVERLIEAIGKFKSQFGVALIITNGTYVPKQSIIEAMKKVNYHLIVRVDDYGNLSPKYNEVVSTLRKNGIEVDERCYTGDEQIYGGWVALGDYTDKHYTDEQVQRIFSSCRIPDDCGFLLDDKLINCGYVMGGEQMGVIPMKEREYVDLSSGQSIEEMREKVRAWRDSPFEACKYCNGFDPVNSPRVPAAVQME